MTLNFTPERITPGFCDGSRNFSNFFRLLRSFCFYTDKTDPLSGKILYHDSVSMIVSCFTFLIEYFVISCYQVPELFCSKDCFAGTSSAGTVCNFS